MKTVTQTLIPSTAIEVVEQIEAGLFATQPTDNTQFFNKYPDGTYVLKDGAIVQVREEQVDFEFVERISNKRTPKLLKKKVIIYFTKDVYDTDGTLFARAGDVKINDGTHTAHIQMRLGIFQSDDYYVDFEKHLGGRISEAINLGNLLNRTDFEKRGCKKDDVKQIVVQMMAENEKENGDGKLSKKQISSLLKQYPFLKPETIAQWQSYDKNSGGRRKPRKVWKDVELQKTKQHFANLERYEGFIILDPREVASWKQTTISTIVVEHLDKSNYLDGITTSDKFLVIFYCSTQKQADDLVKTKDKMAKLYKKMEVRYNIKIETEFLNHK
tara:strand:+ start:1104 stop:2087 length:984 start_codon:yes stop_codon:yes gene_type:complete